MHKFTDQAGREWKIALTYGVLQRVKEELRIDLLDIRNAANAQRMQFDLPGFVNFLYFICDAKSRGIDEQSFWDALGGDVFDEAFAAFQEEYTDFFPKSQRTLMKAALGKTAQTVGMAMEAANQEIEATNTAEAIENMRTSMRGAIDTALKESQA